MAAATLVTGTFHLPPRRDDLDFLAPGFTATISYPADDGNDVVLTAQAAANSNTYADSDADSYTHTNTNSNSDANSDTDPTPAPTPTPARPPFATVYVDDSWVGTTLHTDPDGGATSHRLRL